LTEKLATWNDHTIPANLDGRLDFENSVGTPRLDSHSLTNIDPRLGILDNRFGGEANPDAEIINEKIGHLKIKQELQQESGPSIPALLHQVYCKNLGLILHSYSSTFSVLAVQIVSAFSGNFN